MNKKRDIGKFIYVIFRIKKNAHYDMCPKLLDYADKNRLALPNELICVPYKNVIKKALIVNYIPRGDYFAEQFLIYVYNDEDSEINVNKNKTQLLPLLIKYKNGGNGFFKLNVKNDWYYDFDYPLAYTYTIKKAKELVYKYDELAKKHYSKRYKGKTKPIYIPKKELKKMSDVDTKLKEIYNDLIEDNYEPDYLPDYLPDKKGFFDEEGRENLRKFIALSKDYKLIYLRTGEVIKDFTLEVRIKTLFFKGKPYLKKEDFEVKTFKNKEGKEFKKIPIPLRLDYKVNFALKVPVSSSQSMRLSTFLDNVRLLKVSQKTTSK